MKKSDLKTGMWVEYRNGIKRLVALNTRWGDVLVGFDGNACLGNFKESLEHEFLKDMDIVKVYEPYGANYILKPEKSSVIWERTPQPIEMTLEEACKKLRDTMGKPVKITI
jgi:hypothetical protein